MDNLATSGSGISPAVLWWIGTGVLVAAELASGTFYLLMLALGLAAAAIAAHLHAGLLVQVVVAAVVGCGAVALLYASRKGRPRVAPESDRDVTLDIGNTVDVPSWEPGGRTRIKYRGASWEARYEGSDPPRPGPHVIRALDGNVLVLGR